MPKNIIKTPATIPEPKHTTALQWVKELAPYAILARLLIELWNRK